MNRTALQHRIALALGLLSIAAGLTAQTPAWKAYSYPKDEFSASFPSEPLEQKRSVPSAAGAFNLDAYVARDASAAVFVGVSDYGAKAAGRDPEAVLNDAEKGALADVDAHLVTEKKIALGANSGREFEAENDQFHISARIYLVGTKLYQTLVAFPLKQPYSAAARFLNSFQLIESAKK
jgi:hypothetical protein